MRATNRIEWNRETEGLWYATVYNVDIRQRQRFRAINISRRNWILYIEGAPYDRDWVAVFQVKTWRECREYVEGWFSKWIQSDASSSMSDRRVRIAT